jgi:hypothetical protein
MYDDDDNDADDDACDDSEEIWSMLLLGSSALLLGYLVGRVSYSREVQEALRRIAESPEPIDIFIPTL